MRNATRRPRPGLLVSSLLLPLVLLAAPHAVARDTLPVFKDEAALQAQWRAWREALARERERRERDDPVPVAINPPAPPAPAPAPAPAPTGEPTASLDQVQVTGSRLVDGEGITNNQTRGVDEGGIVKSAGDFLVVLRRGRLFTVRVGDGALAPVDAIDAYAPGADPRGTWIDEMLVSDGTVAVVGYSYARGGTEVGLFDLHEDGTLAYRATYQLRGNDYYSARNYASRLVGRTLLFYSPIPVDLDEPPVESLPALRRWHAGSAPADSRPDDFRRILPARRIHRAPRNSESDITDWLDDLTLHTVTRCTLGDGTMDCESTAVLGPSGRVFYVSQTAVYVWTAPWWADESTPDASTLYRLPLDGGEATALRATGAPIDQMSFLEADGMLNVLVGSTSDGEGMWGSLGRAGELALLRVPLSRMGDGRDAARRDDYRALPGDARGGALVNRHVGDWLVYGRGHCWRDCDGALAHAVRHDGSGPVVPLRLAHQVDRIDALGGDAILVGSAGPDLHFTSVRLAADDARPASAYVHPSSRQGDQRTHGFFYRPTGEDTGIVGLPTLGMDGAGVTYLRNRALHLSGLGTLEAQRGAARDDGCVASCVDWYGNARPIFLRDRIFALLGYELVEGTLATGRIVEVGRVDFAPAPADGDAGHVETAAP
jgi:hypothetical protein